MNFYYLILIPLSIFIACSIILSKSYTAAQYEMLEEGLDDELDASHSRFQDIVQIVGVIAFLFTIVHTTLAAAKFVAGLM